MPATLRRFPLASLLIFIALFTVSTACSVKVDDASNNGDDKAKNKNVDIRTPVGGLHVSEDADVKDIGLPVYPGARPRKKDDDDKDRSNANVNIAAGGFALKVLAVEYESDDAPQKILAFYSNELKKYGKVLTCEGHGDASADIHIGDDDSGELKCGDSKGSSDATELKAGSKSNQHIVSVKPDGKGSRFGLVYVRTHGKDTI